MKVAIIHDWLTGMRGGEKCLEVFCELFPAAELYTLLHKPGTVSPIIERHKINTSFVQKIPFAQRYYRHFLPLFPFAIERIALNGVDLILSSSHCVAKNVRVPEGALHISYIHTPMRYVWDQYEAYFGPGRAGLSARAAMRVLRPWLQRKDVSTAARVHFYLANSRHVAERIRKHYRRRASVIHPPVDVRSFEVSTRDDGYYLMVTALAPYKRVDIAIEAFNRIGLPLKILGSGQGEKRLKRIATPSIEFCGWASDTEVREAYAGCRALVFPGEEDFGIVPVEGMACGKPVIAYGKGGVLETVIPIDGSGADDSGRPEYPTGVLFYEQTAESLIEAVRRFESAHAHFVPGRIREHAQQFNRERFKSEIFEFISAKAASPAFAGSATQVQP